MNRNQGMTFLISLILAASLSACSGQGARNDSTSTPGLDDLMTEPSPLPVDLTVTAMASPILTQTVSVSGTPPDTQDGTVASVNVIDQTLGLGNTLTVDQVITGSPGWIVIHADDNGEPGGVIGYAPVGAGENKSVVVNVTDPDGITTPRLWAVLYVDAGLEGKFDYPGQDVEVLDSSGAPVMESFTIT